MGLGIDHPGGDRPGANAAVLAQVRGYWHALRSQRRGALPHRSDIDPRGIANALTCAFLAERIAPGMARFRLAGTHLADLMGMDVRGMPVASLFDLDARPRLAEVLQQVLAMPGIGDLWLESPRGLGRGPLLGRMVFLPVEGDGEAPLVFGCLVTDGAIGRAPRRLTITRAVVEALDSAPARQVSRPYLPDLAESPAAYTPNRPHELFSAPMTPPPRAKPGRAHLRLVKSD